MRRSKTVVRALGLFLFAVTLASAEVIIPNKIIDSPTAGNLKRGAYNLDFKVYPGGGLLGEVAIGITDNFSLGLAYGGSNIIGAGHIAANDHPGINAQVRIIDENTIVPAFALGYNNQAMGPYRLNDTTDYEVHAKGLYLVASKNYLFLGNFGLHGGLNYRVEEKDPRPDLFFLVNKEINREISLCAEYDAALNDNRIEKGFLNAGLWWIFGGKLQIEFDFKNILESGSFEDVNRELRIVYFDHF
jgi:hypothetical protein